MRVKELFKSTSVLESFAGTAPFLDRENCQVVNKTKNEDSILLHLKRASDGEEGKAYLRVQDQFKTITPQLLGRVFANENIIGCTLNQLENLETNLNIE